jgi:hypothetical protein
MRATSSLLPMPVAPSSNTGRRARYATSSIASTRGPRGIGAWSGTAVEPGVATTATAGSKAPEVPVLGAARPVVDAAGLTGGSVGQCVSSGEREARVAPSPRRLCSRRKRSFATVARVNSEARGTTVLWALAGGLVLASTLVVLVAMRPPEGAPPSMHASDDAPRIPAAVDVPPEPIQEAVAATPGQNERPPASPSDPPAPPSVAAEPLDDRGVVVPAPLPTAAALEALGARSLVPTAVLRQHVLALDPAALPPDDRSKTREEREFEAFTQAYERLGVRLERIRARLAEAERIGDLVETAELRPRVRELEQNRERIAAHIAELRARVERQQTAAGAEDNGAADSRSRAPSPQGAGDQATIADTPR